MGTASAVLENAVFWFLFFVTNGGSYPPAQPCGGSSWGRRS